MSKNRTKNSTPPASNLPPQNIDAEESIISAVLLDNYTLLNILDILSAEDFYRTAHQKIFKTIIEMSHKNEPIDLVTLANALKSNNQLDEIGGAVFLAKLMDTAPIPANAVEYAKIIRDNASLRRMIKAASDISNHCFDNSASVDDVIDFAESTIFDIADSKGKLSYYPLSMAIDANIDALVERRGNKSLISGIPTGYKKLDTLTSGLQGSDLIILAARPGMGKTAFALNITRNIAVDAEVPVVFFSLEMSKEQLSMRLLCSEARIDSTSVRSGFFSDDDWSKLTDAADILSEAPIFLDDSSELTSLDVKTKARRLKLEKNIGLIVIDYLQLMKARKMSDRRDLEISEMSRSLKSLAKELNVPIIALSQLNRSLEGRTDKRPQLSDLRESGALEQDADIVMFIYRDEVYNKDENNPDKGKAEIIIAKHRSGPTGVQQLSFLSTYTRFENIAYGYDEYESTGEPDYN
ncbi:MAG: replicative DNA helicase [Desulfobacteraceae bacterium]|jgi:replicative DNA helicase|nr:replicative DNA helicase [Desulfobacteraceae bacterium]